MTTLADLSITQSLLQDLADCARRFELRWLRGLRYPAPEALPIDDFEDAADRGTRLHTLIAQYHLGVPRSALDASIGDPQIAAWWAVFLDTIDRDLPARDHRHAELTLTAPFAIAGDPALRVRLVAKYDLIARDADGGWTIADWKTSAQRTPRATLAARAQTVLYPYLLVRAGAFLNDGMPIAPDRVRMLYWFAEHPRDHEIFTYDADAYARDQAQLHAWLGAAGADDFPLTSDARRCRFCGYRTYCGRGHRAGDFMDAPDTEPPTLTADVAIDIDQIGEIAF